MDLASRRLDQVANNLANSNTTGYKRGLSFVHALHAKEGELANTQPSSGSLVDYSQGELEHTGTATNFALEGQGFFAVEQPDGEAYTRNGSFFISQDGSLKSMEGYPVAWEQLNGTIDPNGEAIIGDAEGNISQGRSNIGKLKLVNFEDLQRLYLDQEGYLHAPLDLRQTAHEASVYQGHLEGANINPIEEMVQMISIQRAFDSATNLVSMISDTYQRLNRLQ